MTTSLAEIAQHTDEVTAQARAQLVDAVREASAEGMSQTQIGILIGRSQPEVSRLLHFHGTSPLARRLRKHVRKIKRLLADVGGTNLRVFGSVATRNDHKESDVDLLFTMNTPLSLMQLASLEHQISRLLEAEVDLLPDSALQPHLRQRILREAVPL
ncbi:MAG: nucleotidyltransferase domain-containing protein [Propionibacteriaceae bacterium]|nr:nucleotidyltransferase domain-containing protein [Propionibacteriaceae bacterium]